MNINIWYASSYIYIYIFIYMYILWKNPSSSSVLSFVRSSVLASVPSSSRHPSCRPSAVRPSSVSPSYPVRPVVVVLCPSIPSCPSSRRRPLSVRPVLSIQSSSSSVRASFPSSVPSSLVLCPSVLSSSLRRVA